MPLLVVLSCQSAIALGTLFGGWRTVHAMGSTDYASQPNAGLWCRNRWSSDIGWRTWLDIPVSTTPTITAGAWRATLLLRGLSHSPSLRSFQP
ncbi:inorganic phosphate transporter [Rhizobium leguminosarum]|uniref:inorganic phosphate transporter n=1 Tax=Rhizobium leguminosarum TaxID=384 RepID=UPI0013EE8E25